MLDVGRPDAIIVGESVVQQLQPHWSQWCRLDKVFTGWTYRQNEAPYSFYRYDGRWTGPL